MHAYQAHDSVMTLREGLAEYYDVHDNVTPPDEHSSRAAELFRYHDVGHVVFGTTTNLLDEARTDTWLMFGSDVGAWSYTKYLNQPEATAILKEVGYWKMIKQAGPLLGAMWDVWRRTRRMKQKWPWTEHAALMDRPLVDLRRVHGIEVVGSAA